MSKQPIAEPRWTTRPDTSWDTTPQSDKLLDVISGRLSVPPGTFGISIEAAAKIPRDGETLSRLPGLEILQDENVTGFACRTLAGLDRRRVRFVQPEWYNPWILVNDAEDGVLGGLYEEGGCDVVGNNFDFSYLSEAQQVALVSLAYMQRFGWYHDIDPNPAEAKLMALLFTMTPRSVRIPPIDLDANEESAEWNPDQARALSREYARRICEYAPGAGFGRPIAYSTNSRKGSVHVDFLADASVASSHLVSAWGACAIPMLDALGIPHSGNMSGIDKVDRPMIYADVTLMIRYATSRGGLWRPPGAAKPLKRDEAKRVIPGQGPREKKLRFDPTDPASVSVADEPWTPRDWSGRTVSPCVIRGGIEAVLADEQTVSTQANIDRSVDALLSGALMATERAKVSAMTNDHRLKGRRVDFVRGPVVTAKVHSAAEDLVATLTRALAPAAKTEAGLRAAGGLLSTFQTRRVATATLLSLGAAEADINTLLAATWSDAAAAWAAWSEPLGGQTQAVGIAAIVYSSSLANSSRIPPQWGLDIATCVSDGGWPLTEDDVAVKELRDLILADYRLRRAWFRNTGDGSRDEWRFLCAAHDTGLISKAEAVYLSFVRPNSKSGRDRRGVGYAEDQAAKIEENKDEPFGLGVTGTSFDRSTYVTPDRRGEWSRSGSNTGEEADEGDDSWKLRTTRASYVARPELGDEPLSGFATAMAANRLRLLDWKGAVSSSARAKNPIIHMLEALATTLLIRGTSRESTVTTIRLVGFDASTTRYAVDECLAKLEARKGLFGPEWLGERLGDAWPPILDALDTEISTRSAVESERFRAEVAAEHTKIANAHLKTVRLAGLAAEIAASGPDAPAPAPAAADGPFSDATSHVHGESCDHGTDDDPPPTHEDYDGADPPTPQPAAEETSRPRQFLRKVVDVLKAVFPVDASPVTSRAVTTAIALFLSVNVPRDVVAETFRQAGFVQSRNIDQIERDNAKQWPDSLRKRVEETVGRKFSRVMRALERDLHWNSAQLQPATRKAAYEAVCSRWELDVDEREFLERKEKQIEGIRVALSSTPPGARSPSARSVAARSSLANQIAQAGRVLTLACQCGLYRNEFSCESHGDQGGRLIVTDREIACRHCRRRWAAGYIEYAKRHWPERMTLLRVGVPDWNPAPDNPEDRALWAGELSTLRELSCKATKIKLSRFAKVSDRFAGNPNWRLNDPLPDAAGPGAAPADDEDDEEEGSSWGRHMVVAEFDAEEKRALNGLPLRWAYGHDHFLVFGPAVHEVDLGGGVKRPVPLSRPLSSFARWHRSLGRTATEDLPRPRGVYYDWPDQALVVSRDVVLAELEKTLLSTGEFVDDMIRDRNPMLYVYEWLKPSQKRTTANGLGKTAMKWPERTELQAIFAEASEAKLTEEQKAVEPGCCKQLVLDPVTHAQAPCKKRMTVTLRHTPSGSVLCTNAMGMPYTLEEANRARRTLGVPFTLPKDELG